MPLAEPIGNKNLREKVLLIAPGKSGKSSCWLSIAFWAFKSSDKRSFFCIDTEDAIPAVMNEPKYDGMMAEDGGNVHVFPVTEWEDYMEAQEKIMAQAVKGDWIIVDMISHAWPMVQQYWLNAYSGKTRGQSLLEAAVMKDNKGQPLHKGWNVFKVDFRWDIINPLYDDFLKPMLLKSKAHLFLVSEQDEIRESGELSEDTKGHLRDFGKFKFVGQKKLPYQCRSYLRLQRLARGRVLYTLGDRAREEMSGTDMTPDFFSVYLRRTAGWDVVSPEETPTT